LESSKLQRLIKVIPIEKKAGVTPGTKIPEKWADVILRGN